MKRESSLHHLQPGRLGVALLMALVRPDSVANCQRTLSVAHGYLVFTRVGPPELHANRLGTLPTKAGTIQPEVCDEAL